VAVVIEGKRERANHQPFVAVSYRVEGLRMMSMTRGRARGEVRRDSHQARITSPRSRPHDTVVSDNHNHLHVRERTPHTPPEILTEFLWAFYSFYPAAHGAIFFGQPGPLVIEFVRSP
jgi:hypothetical protein